MNKYGFAVRWSDEDAAYVATCPEFAGVSAFGDTAEEALREIRVAMELTIETYEEEGWPLPEPQTVPRYSGQFRLRVPSYLHGQLAERAELEGVSLNTLAVSYLAAGVGAAGAVARTDVSPGEQPDQSPAPRRRRKAA